MSTIPPTQTSEPDDEANPVSDTSSDASVDVSDVLEESQVMEVLHKLVQELVGLKSIKTRIREIAATCSAENGNFITSVRNIVVSSKTFKSQYASFE